MSSDTWSMAQSQTLDRCSDVLSTTSWIAWNDSDAPLGSRMVLKVSDEPLFQHSVRVDLRSKNGALGYQRFHICDLLVQKHLDLDGAGDLEIETALIPRASRVLELEISKNAKPSSQCSGNDDHEVLLLPGDRAVVETTSGALRLSNRDRSFYGPEGVGGKWSQYNYQMLSGAHHGALAAHFDEARRIVHPGDEFVSKGISCISFFVNDTDTGNNEGSLSLRVSIEPGGD